MVNESNINMSSNTNTNINTNTSMSELNEYDINNSIDSSNNNDNNLASMENFFEILGDNTADDYATLTYCLGILRNIAFVRVNREVITKHCIFESVIGFLSKFNTGCLSVINCFSSFLFNLCVDQQDNAFLIANHTKIIRYLANTHALYGSKCASFVDRMYCLLDLVARTVHQDFREAYYIRPNHHYMFHVHQIVD